MTKKHTIYTESQEEAANYSANTCTCEAELEALFHFSEDPGGFEHYRKQFGTYAIWPMAVLLHVEVPIALRKQGYGPRAVEHFVSTAQEEGAVFALLRVGWSGDLSRRDRLVQWYERLGWRRLKYPAQHIVVPFLYRQL